MLKIGLGIRALGNSWSCPDGWSSNGVIVTYINNGNIMWKMLKQLLIPSSPKVLCVSEWHCNLLHCSGQNTWSDLWPSLWLSFSHFVSIHQQILLCSIFKIYSEPDHFLPLHCYYSQATIISPLNYWNNLIIGLPDSTLAIEVYSQ